MNTDTLLLALRKYLLESKKQALLISALLIGIPAILGMWVGFIGRCYSDATLVTGAIMGIIIWYYLLSRAFPELKTPQGRVAFLMNPTPTVCHYFIRLATYTAGIGLLMVSGYLAFCGVNILTRGICYGMWQTPEVFSWSPMDESAPVIMYLAAILLFSAAAYFFGSIAWPRHSFLKTTGLLWILNFAISLVAVFGIKLFGLNHLIVDAAFLNTRVFFWVGIGFIFAIDAAIFVWAYFRLKNLTAV